MNSFEKVYIATSFIPKGKVSTYKKVAKLAGVATPRVVGFALRLNKDTNKIPCHRVVGIKGDLTGYGMGGIKIKRKILEQEGVVFKKDGRVDMEKSLWASSQKQLAKMEKALSIRFFTQTLPQKS